MHLEIMFALRVFFRLLGPRGYPDIGSFTLYSCMWNAMIVPFLNMTIYGAIFYQGETNALAREFNVLPYNCTFSAMINDWRAKWYASTQNNTDPQFPFGFVQVGFFKSEVIIVYFCNIITNNCFIPKNV